MTCFKPSAGMTSYVR